MSALRYSGTLRIRVTYVEPIGNLSYGPGRGPSNGSYRCAIVPTGSKHFASKVVHVGTPDLLSHSVDSPEAFDAVAHCALSFASADEWSVDEYAAPTDSGWHVGRSPETAWEVKHYGFDGSEIRKGARVELSPGTDLWMMGARFGEVVETRSGIVRVRLDKRRKLATLPYDRVRAIPATQSTSNSVSEDG